MNIRCSGTPSFSETWIWAKLGGLAMMASATKGLFDGSYLSSTLSPVSSFSNLEKLGAGPNPLPVSMQDLQQPSIICSMPFLRLVTSPLFKASKPGISPGFLTIKAISSAGSPPILKNSRPFSSTNFSKTGCVAIRTRWWYVSLKTLPNAING